MKKLKFGIIGYGRIGKRHADHIKNLGQLSSVCDIQPSQMEDISKEDQVNCYDNIEALLANEQDTDVISICSPNGLHAEHTIKALNAGFHVLCEKPMALSVEDCGKMIDTSLRVNKRLFIVKQNRFNPPVEAIKHAISDGRLGKILSVQLNCFWNRNEQYYHNSWKGTKDMDGGTLYTQFSHFVDLLYWLIGDIKEVQAFMDNFIHPDSVEFEDSGVVLAKFHNGALGTINFTINAHGKNMEGSLSIFGEHGTVKIGGQYLNELEYCNIKDFEITDLPQGNPPNNYGQYQGSMSNHDKVYENVISVLNDQGVIATNGYEGMKTVEIIDKIYSSTKWSQ